MTSVWNRYSVHVMWMIGSHHRTSARTYYKNTDRVSKGIERVYQRPNIQFCFLLMLLCSMVSTIYFDFHSSLCWPSSFFFTSLGLAGALVLSLFALHILTIMRRSLAWIVSDLIRNSSVFRLHFNFKLMPQEESQRSILDLSLQIHTFALYPSLFLDS
jgi:hypothetical protein